jgi:hypothetical protein
VNEEANMDPITDVQHAADVQLLNDHHVHITMARDGQGEPYPITRELVRALAEVVLAWNKQRQPKTGPRTTIMRHKEGCMEWRHTDDGRCAKCGARDEPFIEDAAT